MLNWPDNNFIENVEKRGFSEVIEKLIENQKIQVLRLSYHPRVLTEAECQTNKMFYKQFVNTGELKLYEIFELKLVSVFKKIFSNTGESYLYNSNGLAKIQNENMITQQIQKSLRIEEGVLLLFPEKQTIISTGYDLTWDVFSWIPLEDNLIIETLKKHNVHVW